MSIPNPIVLLDARARYVHPALTCNRASPKWLFGPDGQRHRVPENAMPWEYDPVTGELMGLRVESAATNLISDTDVDNWSKSNVTVSDAGNGWRKVAAENSGSESRQATITDSFSVVSGNYYTFSFDLRASETGYGIIHIINGFRQSGESAWCRVAFDIYTQSYELSHEEEMDVQFVVFRPIKDGGYRLTFSILAQHDTSAAFRLYLKDTLNAGGLASTLSAGDGLYVRAPQVEVYDRSNIANVDSSWIETTGSAATRSSDEIGILLDGQPWFSRQHGTLVAEAIPWSRYISPVVTLRIDSALSTHGIGFRHNGNDWRAHARNVSGNIINVALSGNSFLEVTRGAVAYDSTADDFAFSANGSVGEAEYPSNFFDYSNPTIAIGRYHLNGSGLGSVCMDGWIRRVVYYPQRISNAGLQSLTALQE